ncbi:MAG: DUF309 domain-containing protein [Desulfobacterales bacterium]|nr:DUF309 domain-containing protein [Desulfobacterales bacterium]
MTRFDPFEDRSCREIRNQLSQGFLKALECRELFPLEQARKALAEQGAPAPFQLAWMDERMARYHWVLSRPLTALDTPLATAALLWDAQLFYECHEWLEEIWLDLKGEEKKAVQGLIRAAGAYVFVQAHRMETAQKTARKAHALIRDHREWIPAVFQPRLLMEKLDPLDPSPPCLTREKPPAIKG